MTCTNPRFDTAADVFEDEYGVTLTGEENTRYETDEVRSGWHPDFSRTFHVPVTITECIATGFSFEVDGVKISGSLKPIILDEYHEQACCFLDDSYSQHLQVRKAIRAKCGPINYGELGV
jgi:hypothetical protein